MEASSTPRIDAQRFDVYTDGSCDWHDMMGGSAAVVRHPTTGELLCRGGCESGASVNRAELRAVLMGLSMVASLSGLADAKFRDKFVLGAFPRLRVNWYTDRANIAGSVTAQSQETTRLFSRDVDADLWATIAWYETFMDIKAHLVPRNSVPEQKEADRISGLLRKAMQSCAIDVRWAYKLELQ